MVEERRKSERIEPSPAALVSLVGTPLIECILKDISATGARFAVEYQELVPDYFKLKIELNGEQLFPKCRVCWRKGNEVGVEFFR